MRQVAITGMGAISPLGNDHAKLWQALLRGENGIRRLTRFDGSDIGVYLAAEVQEFDVTPFLAFRKLQKHLTTPAKYLIAAAHMALEEAGYLQPPARERLRCALIVGAGSYLAEEHMATEPCKREPLWYLETFPNLVASAVSINFGFTGYYNTVVNACASGTKAICDAVMLIQHDICDLALVGATESKITPQHLAGFQRLGVLSQSRDADAAMRPFDRDRDGTVVGEGAGALVLEDYQQAVKRGATIYAVIAGIGCSMDAHRLTEPDSEGSGLLSSMRQAVAHAQINVEQIGYINAHGTSTRANDLAESRAIRTLLGQHYRHVPVSSTKSMIGHATAASGALEAIVCARALYDQAIHATRNFGRASDVCDLDYVPGAARTKTIEYALSNSAGFGGFNASVVLWAGPRRSGSATRTTAH